MAEDFDEWPDEFLVLGVAEQDAPVGSSPSVLLPWYPIGPYASELPSEFSEALMVGSPKEEEATCVIQAVIRGKQARRGSLAKSKSLDEVNMDMSSMAGS